MRLSVDGNPVDLPMKRIMELALENRIQAVKEVRLTFDKAGFFVRLKEAKEFVWDILDGHVPCTRWETYLDPMRPIIGQIRPVKE